MVCDSQSIFDSNTAIAKDMKLFIQKEITAGNSDKHIKQYLSERYGEQILLLPPFKQSTLILWLMPIILLLIGLWVFTKKVTI